MQKLDETILHAIMQAIQAAGSQAALCKASGISTSIMSRYVKGGVENINRGTWELLLPHISPYLPPEYLSHLDIASRWKIAPAHPVLRKHLEQAGKAAQEYTDKFTRDLMQFGMDLGLDIYDQLTIDLLKYWRDMTPARRYLLLSYAARLTEEELPAVEAEPAKKVAGSQVS